MKIFVDFIIPTFNQLSLTKNLLHTLLLTTPDLPSFRIFISDDASTDGTQDWLSSLNSSRIRHLFSSYNSGFGANVNRAAQHSDADIIFFLNNDLVLYPGWLQPILNIFQSDVFNSIGVVGNLQHRVDTGQLDHAGIQMNLNGHLEHIQSLPTGRFTTNVSFPKLAVTGACMAIRREHFLSCGGFDLRYHNGAEDIDLCFKLRQRGLKSLVTIDSRVGHHVSASRGPASLNDEKNSRLLFKRWRGLLKQELADQWVKALHQGGPYPEPPETLVDAALLNTPYLAARRIAEALLVRQEKRWAELLGDDGG